MRDLPAALDVEMTVLGKMLTDKRAVTMAFDTLEDSDFYNGNHRELFIAAKEVYKRNGAVDVVLMDDYIESVPRLNEREIGLVLLEVSRSICVIENYEYYLKRMKILGRLRRAYDNFEEGQRLICSDNEPEKILDEAGKLCTTLVSGVSTSDFEGIDTVLSESLAMMENMHSGGTYEYKTGFDSVDKIIGGLQKEDLIVVAGRPSMGKTSLMMNMALNLARAGVEVMIFSLEMSRKQLGFRLLSNVCGINLFRIIHGMTTREEYRSIAEHAGEIASLPIHIDDKPNVGYNYIRAGIRHGMMKHNAKIAFVDHLHTMNYGRMDQNSAIGTITRELKASARENNMPIVLLSQLNRPDKKAKVYKPALESLRWSGDIEQEADVVMFVHRPEEYLTGDKKIAAAGDAEIIIAKQRNGPTDIARIRFKKETASFYEGGDW